MAAAAASTATVGFMRARNDDIGIGHSLRSRVSHDERQGPCRIGQAEDAAILGGFAIEARRGLRAP
jgi:hypothetical protein